MMSNVCVRKIPYGRLQGYKITECGEMYNESGGFRGKILTSAGLLQFCIKNVREYIHILVARTFIPVEKELPYVIHIDGDLTNNHKDNLIWSKQPDKDHSDFKRIPGFAKYGVSKDGRVKSYFNRHAPQLISFTKGLDGYLSVSMISDEGKSKQMRLNRVVALTYIPNPDNLPEVDHIDRVRSNNVVSNLRWADKNMQARNKNTEGIFRKKICRYNLKKVFVDEFKSARDAVNQLKLDIGHNALTKNAIKNKKGWKSITLGYYWKYTDSDNLYTLERGEEKVPIVGRFGKMCLNYPGYFITNFGTVLNEKGSKLLSYGVYPSYKLYKNGVQKNMAAHILVALFFVKGRTKEKCIVDHLDENKTNPRFDNLEWVTCAENNRRAGHLRFKSINKIHTKTGEILDTFESCKSAGESMGKTNGKQISACANGSVKTAYGFKWEFAD